MSSLYRLAFTAMLMALPLVLESYGYDPKYVEVSTAEYNNEKYIMVTMQRQDKRIKAKYFAARDFNGNSVYERFYSWSRGRNVVLVTSGTYMTDCDYRKADPVGLTIDNGIVVNQNFHEEFDGLVILYPTGGIQVSNLEEGKVSMPCEGGSAGYDLKDSWDRTAFLECTEEFEATVFQTHLLIYKNQLKVYDVDGCKHPPCNRERRFLAVCKDEAGNSVHTIIHYPTPTSLYSGTKKVYEFLREFEEMEEVEFMINLDTGCQNIFYLYNRYGTQMDDIKGKVDIKKAANLLVYYYQ